MKQGAERNIFIFGIFLLLAGVVLSLWGGFVGVRAWLSTTWPTTEGTILSTRIKRLVDVNSTAVEQDKFNYIPVVQYSYTVDGATFTTDNIMYFEDESFGEREDAEAFIQRYQPDSQVMVYYNPANVEHALLEPGITWTTFVPLGFGVFGLIFGLLFVLRPDLF